MENPDWYKNMVSRLAKPGSAILGSLSTEKMILLRHTVKLLILAGIILDEVKRRVIYNKPPKEGLEDRLPKAQADIQTTLGDLARAVRVYEKKEDLLPVDVLDAETEAFFDRTAPTDMYILHMAVGVTGEGCEMLEASYAQMFEFKDLDVDNYQEEHGDVEFYLEGSRQALLFDREDSLKHNEDKLDTGAAARYKEGTYSDDDATARRDKDDESGS